MISIPSPSRLSTRCARPLRSRREIGSAEKGKVWHHIVEKCQENKSRCGFSPESIHNTGNVVAVDRKINERINGHYSSLMITPEGKKKTVRDYMNSRTYEEQFEYGVRILKEYGGTLE